MKLSDFDFDLPEDLIATRPARPRSSARLLLAQGETIADRVVTDLVEILRPGDRLVLNDTKVIPARLSGTRTRPGAAGEALKSPGWAPAVCPINAWLCVVGAAAGMPDEGGAPLLRLLGPGRPRCADGLVCRALLCGVRVCR